MSGKETSQFAEDVYIYDAVRTPKGRVRRGGGTLALGGVVAWTHRRTWLGRAALAVAALATAGLAAGLTRASSR